MRKQFKQLGQGMTEYIIIIALIAIAGIGAFTFFGDGLKQTVGVVTEELTGTESETAQVEADARINTTRDMTDFTESDN
jgi:pilus assembly protein Flp/PilA